MTPQWAGVEQALTWPRRKLSMRAGQRTHSHEVVGGHRQHEQLIDLLDPVHHHLPDRANGLGLAEACFGELSHRCDSAIDNVQRGGRLPLW